MPDEIKPDDSLEEQRPPEGKGTAVNAVADQPGEALDNEESAESSPVEDDAPADDNIEATMRKMLDKDAETPQDGASQPDSDDDFPDLSQVRIEETMADPAEFQQLSPMAAQAATSHNIDLLLDVKMPVSIELGRTEMPISELLTLGPGSVVELDKLAGEPVDLLVNDKIIAKGEVVVVDENFGVRITMLMSPEERLKSLAKQ